MLPYKKKLRNSHDG